jgi:hypothetical protein
MRQTRLSQFKEIFGLYKLQSRLKEESVLLIRELKPGSSEDQVQAVLHKLAELSLVSKELEDKWEEW